MCKTTTMKSPIILWSFCLYVLGKGNKLPVCSKSETVPFRRLCKVSTKYSNNPVFVQPKITIGEVLDIDEMEKSMTVSMETLLLWNDSLVSVEGNNASVNQRYFISLLF